MSAKYFIDTNIFVYSFDDFQPKKKEISLLLIANALQSDAGIVSWQVVQEFLNVATRKFKTPMKVQDARAYLRSVLNPLCKVFPNEDIFNFALEIAGKTLYTFYDSLILAGAIAGNCDIVYSEDMQSGQQVENVRIVNPYV